MKNNIAISVKGLSKGFKVPHERHDTLKAKAVNIFSKVKYSKYIALEDISFDIKKGEFFGIVGKNGCGKSTLLKIIAGIYQPTKGKIQVNGNIAPFIELGVGFNPELTGRENVFLSGTILGMSRKKIESLYEEIVDFAEMKEFMDQKLKNYSSGMQVRLAFSIAVRADSDILLIDEVLAVGDAAFQQKCFSYFQKLKEDGKTVCFVTHDMGSVQRFCDRGVIIEKGKMKLIGSPTEIADIYREDNLEQNNTSSSRPQLNKKTNSIVIKIVENNKITKKIKLKFSYSNITKSKAYIGFSIIKDGSTIAELNSLGFETDKKIVELDYILDINQLNSGLYEISAALLDFNTKGLICITAKREQFNILGFDNTRGGAIQLPKNWIMHEES